MRNEQFSDKVRRLVQLENLRADPVKIRGNFRPLGIDDSVLLRFRDEEKVDRHQNVTKHDVHTHFDCQKLPIATASFN